MKQVNLQDVGLTDRYNRNRAQSNFKAIEDAIDSNAITAEEMYAELNGKLVTEANTRAEADKELDGKINQSVDRLSKRITAIERILFGESPQEVKMADNSTPPLANGGAMLINLVSKEDK